MLYSLHLFVALSSELFVAVESGDGKKLMNVACIFPLISCLGSFPPSGEEMPTDAHVKDARQKNDHFLYRAVTEHYDK